MGKYNLKVKRDEYVRVVGREAAGRSREEAQQEHVSMRRLLAESRPEAGTLALATLALFASAGANLAIPALFGRVIDSLTRPADGGKAENEAALRVEVLLLVAVSLASAVTSYCRSYLFAVAGERVVARLRDRLFTAILHQGAPHHARTRDRLRHPLIAPSLSEIGFFDQSKTGELISRLGGDTTVLKEAATSNISQALRWAATVIGGIAYLFAVSWKLTLVMLAIVPAVGIGARLYGRYVKRLSKDARQALAEASEVAEETLSNIRTVRSFANEARQEQLYQTKIAETLRLGIATSVAGGLFNGATTAITSLAFIAIVYYGEGSRRRASYMVARARSYMPRAQAARWCCVGS